jgi:ketosteroid isomerase-like protein
MRVLGAYSLQFEERPLRKLILALLGSVLVASGMSAATPDVTATIHQFLDAFNAGDTKSINAAYSTGDIAIVDEFAPHLWLGPHAPQDWAADYDKNAQATGLSDGIVKYGAPTRTEIEGDAAYVIVPMTYLYKQHGQPIAEEGQMTFVLHADAGGWKIRGWTWSGVKPHPAK